MKDIHRVIDDTNPNTFQSFSMEFKNGNEFFVHFPIGGHHCQVPTIHRLEIYTYMTIISLQ